MAPGNCVREGRIPGRPGEPCDCGGVALGAAGVYAAANRNNKTAPEW